jgi:hypothetical protein
VTAFRLDADPAPWLDRDRRVFLAFDATDDFGSGGRAAAHDVLEGLIGALPPGCKTALIAFDGTVKFDPDKLMLHLPVRAESMLDRLWRLEAAAEEGGGLRFLAGALLPVTGLEGESIVVMVTGRGEPGDPAVCRQLLSDARTRLVVIQVGAGRPSSAYRALCAETGGVALAIPPAMAPELGVLDFLANLSQPAVSAVVRSAGGAPAHGVLAGPGDFANQPVVTQAGGAGGQQARLTVQVGEEAVACDEDPRGASRLPTNAAQADALLRVLGAADAARPAP